MNEKLLKIGFIGCGKMAQVNWKFYLPAEINLWHLRFYVLKALAKGFIAAGKSKLC